MTTKSTKRLALAAALLVAAAAAAPGGGLDNNPLNAGETQFRNAWGLPLDGVMGNPALLGLDARPRGGLSLLPLSAAVWSDKLSPPPDPAMFVNPSRSAADYLSMFMRESFGLGASLSPKEVSEKLTRELSGETIGVYAGTKASPVVFATRGGGLSVGSFIDVGVKIPGDLLMPLFSDSAGLLAGRRLDVSGLRVEAMWASEVAVKLGYSTNVPFFSEYLKLDKAAAGAGVKLLLGHAYVNAQMEKGGAVYYDTVDNKYKASARLNVMSVGTGFYDDFRYDGGALVSSPINGEGVGFDFGAVFHNDNHALSADVRDVGVMVWNGGSVRKGRVAFDAEFDLNDLYLGARELFSLDAAPLARVDTNQYIWLPAALDVGYAYNLRFGGGPGVLLGYLAASLGYSQQLALGIGRDTYRPRFSAGAALGLLAGCLPVRYGVSYGGPERLASAAGVGLDARYISVDAFYKAVGSPALRPVNGFEAGGALTFRWGFRRRAGKVKDAPEAEEGAEGAPADTAPEPAAPEEPEFFPDEGEPEVIYEPIAQNFEELPPEPKPEPRPEEPPQPTAAETRALGASQRAINFVPGSATLTEGSYAPLDAIAELLAQYPHVRYEVQGHTDSHGAEVYNLLLSAERAAVVKYYLMLRGAPESSLVAVGYGKNIPIADNSSVVGRALNRRVEFVPIQSQEHYDWVKRFELDMIPRLTHRIINGKIIVEPKPAGE